MIFCHGSEDIVQYVYQTCYYVNGQIGSVKGKFLVDTGSSICVLSEYIFGRLNGENINLCPTDRRVRKADGNLLKLKGTCELPIQLHHIVFTQEFGLKNHWEFWELIS